MVGRVHEVVDELGEASSPPSGQLGAARRIHPPQQILRELAGHLLTSGLQRDVRAHQCGPARLLRQVLGEERAPAALLVEHPVGGGALSVADDRAVEGGRSRRRFQVASPSALLRELLE
eukprot:13158878-Alexandrium_andersonii.AAC.1